MRRDVIKILHEMQKWRRGGKGEMPFSPNTFGAAIDICIRMLRRVSDEQFNQLMNEDRTDRR